MPIYEYYCPETEEVKGPDAGEAAGTDTSEVRGHLFEKIVSMSDMEKTQPCPIHGKECQRVEFSTPGKFLWGKEVIHWAAGLGHRGGYM